MIRIGRQIPHFDQVDAASVRADFSADRRFRYALSMRFSQSLYDQDRTKRAAVILKNPSAADVQGADSTIRKVETYVYHHLSEVKELFILNLFALRATDALDLNREYREKGYIAVTGERNDQTIKKICSGADFLIVAWGNNSGIDPNLYSERIGKVKNLLSDVPAHKIFEVRGKRETEQPLHGMMWGYDFTLLPCLKMKEEE